MKSTSLPRSQPNPICSTTRGRRLFPCVVACLMAFILPAVAQVPGTPIYVLNADNTLTTATLNAPGTAGATVEIVGVVAGDTLVSIDVRPQNAGLYALGVNATADTLRLYYLSPQSGSAVALGSAAFGLTAFGEPVDLPLDGWDIDFNPAVDRLRVVTSSGLNFRINPNTGTPVDSDGESATGNSPDGEINIASVPAGVNGTAYTNNQPNNGNLTTQYAVDATTDSLYIQNPPNSGTLTTAMAVMVDGSALDITGVSGFDIEPGVNAAASGSPVSAGFAYSVLSTATTSKLYRINLANGQATALSNFAPRSFALRLVTGASIGLSSNGTSLVRFSPLTPGTTTAVTIGAITSGETLVGIDMRPATGQFYGLGIDPVLDTGTLYLIDPQLGGVTVVGTPSQIAYKDGTGIPTDFPLISAGYDIDFNPTVDRLRVVTGNTTGAGLNFRINPNDGLPVDGALATSNTNPDGAINGGTTVVSATAYTNNFGGATVTTQYTLDASSDSLYIQNPPNNGTQNLQFALTEGGDPMDFAKPVGFDILNNVTVATSASAATGDGYFTAIAGGNTFLFRLNLATGAATSLGAVATGLSSFAIFSAPEAPTVTHPTATSLTINSAVVGGTVAFEGGTSVTERGVVLAVTAQNPDPPQIGGTGVTKTVVAGSLGTFSTSVTGLMPNTSYTYRAYATNAVGTRYTAATTFTTPVLTEPVFPVLVVGQLNTYNLELSAGTTVTAKGLPSGLVLNPRTGVITGRPTAAGVFMVTLSAKGPGGVINSYVTTFVIRPVPKTAVGAFVGLIQANSTLNGGAAGRIDLTTTATASYTLKVSQRTKSYTVKGFLSTSVSLSPTLTATLADGSVIALTLNANNTLAGTLTHTSSASATISGWRKTFDKTFFPADVQMGYYTVELKLGASDVGDLTKPQGSGYASITVGLDGSTVISGRAADGSGIACSSFMGPNGETLAHMPVYASLGSVSGVLTFTPDASLNYTENAFAGTLAWTKPATVSRTYPNSFVIALDVAGKYMANSAKNSIVVGLPSSSDPSTLDFSEGGLSAASLNPDLVNSVTFLRPSLKAVVPPAGSPQNPARTSLTINAANGLISGSFTLQDGALKRVVSYQGMIVRRADGSTTANGYFLLPQIPTSGQTINNSPILSGRVDLIP